VTNPPADDLARVQALEALLRAGGATEVVRAFAAEAPRDADAANLLGRAHVALGDLASARAAFERARALAPEDARAVSNLANVAAAEGDLERAVALYEEALSLRPEAPKTLANLAALLDRLGRSDEAHEAATKALELDPTAASAAVTVSRAIGRAEGAAAALAFLESRSACRGPLVEGEKGTRLLELDRVVEARAHLERAVAVSPDNATLIASLGACLRRLDRFSDAIEILRRALALAPDLRTAHLSLGMCLREVGEATDAVAHLATAERLSGFDPDTGSAKLCAMLLDERASVEAIASAHRDWGARVSRSGEAWTAPRERRPGPLRVGYLSGHFRSHVVMSFLAETLRAHDRGRFDVRLLSCGVKHDQTTAALRRALPFVDLAALRGDALEAAVRELDLDVLVDLDGHTGDADDTRIASLAKRLARAQATYLGYPSSTGLTAVDYRITDGRADPPGTELEFTEELVRLPDLAWAFTPPCDVEPRRARPRVEGPVVLGCMSRLEKIGPSTLAAWRRILEARPATRLVLKARVFADPGVRARVLATFGAALEGRVQLRAWVGTAREHYEAYREIDVALDTFPYNGTTTICDALWMGVPMVSRWGETAASRVGRALLGAVGLDRYAAADFDEYVARVVELVDDDAERLRLHAELPGRARASSLGDPVRLARQLEEAYVTMARRHGVG
jgi:predicted O-linked N-acetylglucosamine transferase (SPINDLY family)